MSIIISDYYRKDGSDYVCQSLTTQSDFTAEGGWVVLSGIEASIKRKIEAVGTPLKDWDVNIYRGILTGYNDAFIIDKKTRDVLIAASPKNAEIIRPILKGRDIKKYTAVFADQWIIFTRRGIDIDSYPAIKKYLMQFHDLLKPKNENESIGRKPGSFIWYEIKDNVAYYLEFEKEKVVWQELSRTGAAFCFIKNSMYLNNTAYALTGLDAARLKYLTAILNNKLSLFYLEKIYNKLDNTGWRWLKNAVERIPVISFRKEFEIISQFVDDIQDAKQKGMSTIKTEEDLQNVINDLYNLAEEEIAFINAHYK